LSRNEDFCEISREGGIVFTLVFEGILQQNSNYSKNAMTAYQKDTKSSQWENISITSMEVDFWRVKNSSCENSHATEVKCSNIPQKS
jgi:hypothetical protein